MENFMKKLAFLLSLILVGSIHSIVTQRTSELTRQPDNKVLMGGYIEQDGKHVAAIERTLGTQDPTLDSSFGTEGVVFIAIPYAEDSEVRRVTVLPDQKILLEGDVYLAGVGEAEDAKTRARFEARLKSNGTLDTTFADYGIKIISENVKL